MQTILTLVPLIAFVIAYSREGIYVATSVLMGATAVVLVIDYIRERKIPTMHAVSAALVFVFGAATLILHDKRFIQWKPTVLYWLLAAALLGSMWIGKQPLVQRFLSPMLEGQIHVADAVWRRVNVLWVLFYALLGAANLIVALNATEATWVNFKVWVVPIAVFVFTGVQIAWLMRQQPSETPSPQA